MRVDHLRESNELLNLLMDSMITALFLTDEDESRNQIQKRAPFPFGHNFTFFSYNQPVNVFECKQYSA